MDYTSIILNQLQEAWDNSFAKQVISKQNPVNILGQSVIISPMDCSSVTTLMLTNIQSTMQDDTDETDLFLNEVLPEILVNLWRNDTTINRGLFTQKTHTETVSELNRFTTYNTYIGEEIAFQVNWVVTDFHHIITIIDPAL